MWPRSRPTRCPCRPAVRMCCGVLSVHSTRAHSRLPSRSPRRPLTDSSEQDEDEDQEQRRSRPGSAQHTDTVTDFDTNVHSPAVRANGGARRRGDGDDVPEPKSRLVNKSSSVVWFNDDSDERPTILVPGVFFIFHPYSSPRLSWDVYVIALLVYTVFQVPAAIAFQSQMCAEDLSTFDLFLSLTVDISFWIDILLTFRTAVIDANTDTLTQLKLIVDWKRIAKVYLRGWFWLDVMGSIPMQLVEAIILASNQEPAGAQQEACSYSALKTFKLNRLARLARLVKLLRLARLARWNRLVTKAKDALAMNPGHVRLLQWVIFVLVLAHLFACVLYGIVSLEMEYERTWATGVTTVIPGVGVVVLQCPLPTTDPETDEIMPDSPTRVGTDHQGAQVLQCMQADGTWVNEAGPYVKYLMSLYVTFTTLTTVGYGDVTMRTSPELFLAIIMMAGGASTFAVVVGNMAGVPSLLLSLRLFPSDCPHPCSHRAQFSKTTDARSTGQRYSANSTCVHASSRSGWRISTILCTRKICPST